MEENVLRFYRNTVQLDLGKKHRQLLKDCSCSHVNDHNVSRMFHFQCSVRHPVRSEQESHHQDLYNDLHLQLKE